MSPVLLRLIIEFGPAVIAVIRAIRNRTLSLNDITIAKLDSPEVDHAMAAHLGKLLGRARGRKRKQP